MQPTEQLLIDLHDIILIPINCTRQQLRRLDYGWQCRRMLFTLQNLRRPRLRVVSLRFYGRRRRHGRRQQRRRRRCKGLVFTGLQHPQSAPLVEVLVAGMQHRRASSSTSVRRRVVGVVVVFEAEDPGEERSSTPVDVQLRLEMAHSPVNDQGSPQTVSSVAAVRPHRHQLL